MKNISDKEETDEEYGGMRVCFNLLEEIYLNITLEYNKNGMSSVNELCRQSEMCGLIFM